MSWPAYTSRQVYRGRLFKRFLVLGRVVGLLEALAIHVARHEYAVLLLVELVQAAIVQVDQLLLVGGTRRALVAKQRFRAS